MGRTTNRWWLGTVARRLAGRASSERAWQATHRGYVRMGLCPQEAEQNMTNEERALEGAAMCVSRFRHPISLTRCSALFRV
jgi:hypothetical protein